MQYLGGKENIAKHICAYLESVRKPNQLFVDLTVGGLSIISRMTRPKKGYDLHDELMYFYQFISHNPEMLEELPEYIDEDEYQQIKQSLLKKCWYRSFVGFGCSYGGRYFQGYARGNSGRSYAKNAKNSLRRKFKDLYGVEFKHLDLFEYTSSGNLIYIDPPYVNTKKYEVKFNYNKFWDKVRELSKDNDVYVSEYTAPEDFECVLEIPKKLGVRNKKSEQEIRIEKLFTTKR